MEPQRCAHLTIQRIIDLVDDASPYGSFRANFMDRQGMMVTSICGVCGARIACRPLGDTRAQEEDLLRHWYGSQTCQRMRSGMWSNLSDIAVMYTGLQRAPAPHEAPRYEHLWRVTTALCTIGLTLTRFRCCLDESIATNFARDALQDLDAEVLHLKVMRFERMMRHLWQQGYLVPCQGSGTQYHLSVLERL